jgi:hypothetical protein
MSLIKNVVRTMATLHDSDGSISVIGFYVYMGAAGIGVVLPLILFY